MSDFIKQRIIKAAEQGMARAQALLDIGKEDEAIDICNQVMARAPEAAGPNILGMQLAMKSGDWDRAKKHAELALRTRPRFEQDGLSTGLGVSYVDIANSLAAICDSFNALLAETTGVPIDQFQVPSQLRYYQGLSDHIRGRFSTAREHYIAVLADNENAHYLVGQTLNLLAALEYQAGTPENSKKWIDCERYPLELQPLGDVDGSDVAAFNENLFDEIMASPKLQAWSEVQSEAWYIAPLLNDETAGPHVRKLEQEFLTIAEQNLQAFADTSPVPHHATFGKCPEEHDVEMFAAVLKGPGHVGPHVHSDCFLVGNYYVRVPEEPPDAPPDAGAIDYGKHLFTAATGDDYARRRFHPKAGTMLMWPAYFSHGTIPSTAPGVRMVVGFDLVPKGATGTYGKLERQ